MKILTEKQSALEIREFARRIYHRLKDQNIPFTDIHTIAQCFDVELIKGVLPEEKDGAYIETSRTIIINKRISSNERIVFTFYHELMHHFIKTDDDLISMLHDTYFADKDIINLKVIERLCNLGAAEIIVPVVKVRNLVKKHDFSIHTIKLICNTFQASSIASAIQMVAGAEHKCYLVIAIPTNIVIPKTPMFITDTPEFKQTRLKMIYTVTSNATKYSIKNGQILDKKHPISLAYYNQECFTCEANIPFASKNWFEVPCDIMPYRNKVFAIFNENPPISSKQLQLL